MQPTIKSKILKVLLVLSPLALLIGYRVYTEKVPTKEYLKGTVKVESNGQTLTMGGVLSRKIVTLAHIEVPPNKAREAKWYLEDTIKNRDVSIEIVDKSSSSISGDGAEASHLTGILYLPEGNVNYAMVKYGLATQDGTWPRAEAYARKNQLGIWKTQEE